MVEHRSHHSCRVKACPEQMNFPGQITQSSPTPYSGVSSSDFSASTMSWKIRGELGKVKMLYIGNLNRIMWQGCNRKSVTKP